MTETIGYLTKDDFEKVVAEHNKGQAFAAEMIFPTLANRLWKLMVAANKKKFSEAMDQQYDEPPGETPMDDAFMEATLLHYWENNLPLSREDFFKLPVVSWAEAVEFPPASVCPLHPMAVYQANDDSGVRWKAVWTGEKIGRCAYG